MVCSYTTYSTLPQHNEMLKKNFPFAKLPSAEELQNKMDIVLVNTHYSYETVEPLPPNLIPVGGLQIGDPQPIEKVKEFSLKPQNTQSH